MTSKYLGLTLGLLYIAGCNPSTPALEEASSISKAATKAPIENMVVVDAGERVDPSGLDAKIDTASEAIVVGTSVEPDGIAAHISEESQKTTDSISESVVEELFSYPTITLRRGESIAHFARWSGSTVEEIAELSSVSLDGDYPVGLELTLPISTETLAAVETQREAHRVARVDGYLASRGGSDQSEFYTVKTGDTAWSISKDAHGIPVWVLESYNPSVNLDKLRPGQELMVPVLTDTLVDASSSPSTE